MSDDFDLDYVGMLARAVPQGPDQGDDTAVFATGVVRDIDTVKRRARVALRGGETWLPAIAARYKIGAPVRVLLDPTAGRPILVAGPVDVRPPALLGQVISGPTGGYLTVLVEGTQYTLPAPMGAYTVGASAWAMTDDWGAPFIVIGPSSEIAPGAILPPPPAGGSVVNATATIGPQSTGTYRSSFGSWDTWGNDIHGGVADIYQGEGYGSGPLIGLACYGDQVVNLGAVGIQKMTLTAVRNGSGSGGALTVQGAPHGSRPAGAPSSSGSTATAPAVGAGTATAVDLPSDVCEAFRTGSTKGLTAVGAAYAGFGGTTVPGSFVLSIQYTHNA